MAIQNPLSVPYWLPRLEGKSNWAEWRRNIEEAIHEVDRTAVYWDIIMDRPFDDIKEEAEISAHTQSPTSSSLFCSSPSNEESGSDPDVIITGSSFHRDFSRSRGSHIHSRRVLNIRAREILGSSLDMEPKKAIDRVSDAREAYLKLESLYGGTSAQSIYVAWEKWVKIKYARRNIPKDFVERFKTGLQDVRDQSVDISATVVLAQFQQAIKNHPDTTKFMADMKADIYDPELMQKVYENFEKSQTAPPPQGSESIFASFLAD